MKREGRWDSQKLLVKRITRITTRILPEGEGVALRFINQDVDNSSDLTLAGIGDILDETSWMPNSFSQLGTNLRSKILQPLVYSKLETKSLERPLLISVITDGVPSKEKSTEFVDAILECGNYLEQAGYSRESACPILPRPSVYARSPADLFQTVGVRFMVGQIGTGVAAARFLQTLRDDARISDVVYCTSGRPNVRFGTPYIVSPKATDKPKISWTKNSTISKRMSGI